MICNGRMRLVSQTSGHLQKRDVWNVHCRAFHTSHCIQSFSNVQLSDIIALRVQGRHQLKGSNRCYCSGCIARERAVPLLNVVQGRK